MGVSQWAAHLSDQGRYVELLRRVEAVSDPDDPRYAQARIWQARCLLEQGYTRRGHLALRGLPDRVDGGAELRLWRDFLALYGDHDDSPAASMRRLEQTCRECDDPRQCDPQTRALAGDLRSRAAALRFLLDGNAGEPRRPLMEQVVAAARAYTEAGCPRDASATLQRAAAFGADGRAADRAMARELLLRARDVACEHDLAIAAAEAELGLAEYALRDVLAGRPTVPELAAVVDFDRLAVVFAAAGHSYARAKVRWRLSRQLLVYGDEAGVDEALDAAAGFAAADVPSAEQAVWAALNSWHTLHGDPARADEARTRQAVLAAAMGYGLAAEVRALDEANQALRAGDVARVGPLLAGNGQGSAGLSAAKQVLTATSAGIVGLTEESRGRLEELVGEANSGSGGMVLGEALAVLASQFAGVDDARAAALLDRAAEVARRAEAPIEQARYLSQAAWTRALGRHAKGLKPVVDDQVAADFDRAGQLLDRERTLDARTELVSLCQHRGQAAFFGENWEDCSHWFTRAETLARTLGLLPQLAGVLSYQSLVLITLARRNGPRIYDHAAGRLAEAEQLYEQVGLRPFVWRVLFYRALCDIEAARWPAPPEATQPPERLARARGLMESASANIDLLRQASESDADRMRHQQVRIAFSDDKQTFYEQGFQLAWDALGDPVDGWEWLERAKSRALLDALASSADGVVPAADGAAPMRYAETLEYLRAECRSGGRRLLIAQYLCTPMRTIVFLARADRDTPHVVVIALDHAALRNFAAMTFRVPGGVRMMAEDFGDAGIEAWHRFAGLIAPLAAHCDPEDVVYLAPSGILHDLPLHTLPLDGAPLIERNPVAYIPTAALLRPALARRPDDREAGLGPAAVFGDSRGDLPSARTEATAIAELFGVEAVLGDDVDRERVLAALRDNAVVHIAGHGRVSAEDGFDSHMDLAGTDTVRAADLLPLRLRAGLVVLSGCETGVSEQRPGEELVGFTRALLLSGVPSAVSSQWRVADASTRELLARFHAAARDPSLPLAEALRRAVLAVRALPGYRHLYHWGGFTLTGAWR